MTFYEPWAVSKAVDLSSSATCSCLAFNVAEHSESSSQLSGGSFSFAFISWSFATSDSYKVLV